MISPPRFFVFLDDLGSGVFFNVLEMPISLSKKNPPPKERVTD